MSYQAIIAIMRLPDAQATAELLLAQCHQISRGKELKVGELT